MGHRVPASAEGFLCPHRDTGSAGADPDGAWAKQFKAIQRGRASRLRHGELSGCGPAAPHPSSSRSCFSPCVRKASRRQLAPSTLRTAATPAPAQRPPVSPRTAPSAWPRPPSPRPRPPLAWPRPPRVCVTPPGAVGGGHGSERAGGGRQRAGAGRGNPPGDPRGAAGAARRRKGHPGEGAAS